MSDAILSKFGSSGLAENLVPYMKVTPTLIPAFAALIRHESAPTGSEPLRGDALSAVLCHIMRALAEEKPTIWVIEDLHFAAGDARNAVLTMARALRPHRVLLVLSARQLPEEDHVHLSRLDYYKRLPLGRLGARDVIELLRDAFQSEALAEKLGGKIAYKSDGVPFFVFEMIRGLREGSFLKQNPDGTYVQTQMITDIEVPSAVKDLIETRLRGLDKSERAILEVGAVHGYEFDPDLVARVLEKKKVGVLQDLAEVERRSGIVQGKAGACRFDQYQIQEVLYKDLMPDLRAEYHALLADALEAREEFDPEDAEPDEALFMARHHLLGSRPKAARPYLDAALDYLVGAYQNDAAIELIVRALGAKRLLKGEDRLRILLRLASRLNFLGRREEQWVAIQEALELTAETENLARRADVLNTASEYFSRTSQYEEALRYAQDASELTEQIPEDPVRWSALNNLSTVLRLMGRGEESLRLREELLEMDRASGNAAREWSTMGSLGVAYWILGRYAERMRCHEVRMERSSEAGRSIRSIALHNIANVYSDLGVFDKARELQSQCLRLTQEIGHRLVEGWSLFELAKIEERTGNSADALRSYRAAAALFAEIGEQNHRVGSLIAEGRLRAADGDQSRSLRCLEEAVEIAREFKLHGVLQLGAAWHAYVSGKDDGTAAQILSEKHAQIPHHEKMEGHFVLWKATGSNEHLQAAHRLLTELRENAPEEYRKSMIENVPLNREIMEAAEV
jgi:tetratricopeptide (TPR) repeat protein